MKKIVFTGIYPSTLRDIGDHTGGVSQGNHLLYPFIILKEKLSTLGYEIYSSEESPIHEADIVVFCDINKELYQLFTQLPKNSMKILVATESPIYAPLSHDGDVVADSRWDAVLTWNRSFEADHILYYDIPIAGIDVTTDVGEISAIQKDRKGIVVSSYKGDVRGTVFERDILYEMSARRGVVELYGQRWKEDPINNIFGKIDDKVATIAGHSFSLVIENSVYPGYVTEKIGYSILAGVPVIYYGDIATASRRFPGTFVALSEILYDAVRDAEKQLQREYEEILDNVRVSRKHSTCWCDSYIEAFLKAVKRYKMEEL